MSDSLGTLVSLWQVEQALIGVLQDPPPTPATMPRVTYYLAEVERQTGLPPQTLPLPPGPSSYRGGVDADTMMAEWFPMITVIVEPDGAPQYLDGYTVSQVLRAQVVAKTGDDSEDTARMIADAYGAAIARCVLDAGTLGGVAAQTRLTSGPTTSLLDAANARQVVICTVEFSILIAPMFTLGAPLSWAASPYTTPPALPEVQTTDATIVAQAL